MGKESVILLMLISLCLSGCCCPSPMGSQPGQVKTTTGNPAMPQTTVQSSEQISPLEFAAKSREFQKLQMKYIEAQSNGTASPQELEALEQELEQRSEEMRAYAEKMQNSNNPLFQNAGSAMNQAYQKMDEAQERQRKAMEEAEYVENGYSSSKPGNESDNASQYNETDPDFDIGQ